MDTPFERIVISFDVNGFNQEVQEIQEIADGFNAKIMSLENNHEIKLTDREIKKYIIEKEDPSLYINSLYTEFPKHLRELGQSKIAEFFNDLKHDYNLTGGKFLNSLEVKKNKVIPDVESLEKLRLKYERSLDNERAKIAYETHITAYEAVKTLIRMANEQKIFPTVSNFFNYDKEMNVNLAEIDYNRL